MTLLVDLKKIRRTRWSRLVLSEDCPTLASCMGQIAGADEGRTLLLNWLRLVEGSLESESSLRRYSPYIVTVLSLMLGLHEPFDEQSAEVRYEAASRVAAVPVTTLRTRDSNLLLDAVARMLMETFAPVGNSEGLPFAGRPYNADNVTARDCAHTGPSGRAALEELSPRFGEMAWRYGCRPILAIEDDPARLRSCFSYTAGIEYRRIGSVYVYQVSSSFRCVRTLPPQWQRGVDVAFCRTNLELERQFLRAMTVSVELCDLEAEVWQETASSQFASTLHVANRECGQVMIDQTDDLMLVRFSMPDSTEIDGTGSVPVAVRNTYLIPGSARVYPIRSGDYFSTGPLEMTVTLFDPRADGLDAFVFLGGGFTARGTSDPEQIYEIERFLAPAGTRQQTVRVRCRDGSLLWPRSGAVFVWRRR